MWQRELWYRIKPTGLFANPEEVNRRVLDVCGVLGEQCGGRCPREALGVIASPRGFMSGAVSLLLPDSEQLLPLDSVVYPIPGDPEECSALVFAAGSLARCVLVVEKESVFRCADTYDPRSLPRPTRASPLCVCCAYHRRHRAACTRSPSHGTCLVRVPTLGEWAYLTVLIAYTAGLPTPRRRRLHAKAALPAAHRVRLPGLRVTRGTTACGRRTRCACALSSLKSLTASAVIGPATRVCDLTRVWLEAAPPPAW